MEKAILYSTESCPKCKLIKTRLDQAKIDYVICDDIDLMLSMGMASVPALGIDNKVMSFSEIISWLSKEQK